MVDWKSKISENRQSFTDHNFSVKCSFLIVLGLFESLDIDLSGSFEILKKYSLSSEIQLTKVGRISENPGLGPKFFPRTHGSDQKSDQANGNTWSAKTKVQKKIVVFFSCVSLGSSELLLHRYTIDINSSSQNFEISENVCSLMVFSWLTCVDST